MSSKDKARRKFRPFMAAVFIQLGATLWLLVGCGTTNQQGDEGSDETPTSSGSRTPRGPRAESVEVIPRSLEMAPGDSAELQLRLTPAGVYPLYAALIGPNVAAFLNYSEAATDEDGTARLRLTVATDSEPFAVRISVGQLTTEIPVTLKDRILADLDIQPQYDGKRVVETWHVTVVDEADCSDYAAYTQDTTLPFSFDSPIELSQVPAANSRTILVRGEQYVFGCKASVLLSPTRDNVVRVSVADRPLQLGQISMPLLLGMEASAALRTELNLQIEQMVAVFNAGKPDSVALVEKMAARSEDPEALLLRSQQDDWAGKLNTQLGLEGAAHGLSSVVRGWLFSGTQRLYTHTTLQGRLKATPGTPGKATYTLSSIAGVTPRSAGAPEFYLATIGADAEDTLRVAFELYFQPSKLLSAVGEAEALRSEQARLAAALDGGTPPPFPHQNAAELLASLLDCEALGNSLTKGVESKQPDAGDSGCAAPCLADLCRGALADMWRAAAASSKQAAQLDLSAGAAAEIDSSASVLGLTGGWVGKLELSEDRPALPIRGPFTTIVPIDSSTE